MPVISNTSPILNLAIIEHLYLLRRQFGEVLIPAEVRTELKPESDYLGARLVQEAIDEQWLRVVDLKNQQLAQALGFDLDQGEAAAIALALEHGHKKILLDERDGRAKAKALGLQPIGILGILLRARYEDQIASVKTVMNELKREAGFFIADDLYDDVLLEAGEH